MATFSSALSDINVYHGINSVFEFPTIFDPEGLSVTLILLSGPSFILFDSVPVYHIEIRPNDQSLIGNHPVEV
jgi:hypothetical protein